MQAIILAAGMGKRLKQLTKNNTKCMVEVNGRPLIDRTLSQLCNLKLSRIVIVVGYEKEKLIRHIEELNIRIPVVFIDNPIYDKTNNIYSLSLAADYLLMEDTLLLESDIIFEDSVLTCLVKDERDSLALVAKYQSWMDGTCVRLSADDEIEAIIPGKKFSYSEADSYYKTVNIYKFSRTFSETRYVPFLKAYTTALGNNEYYEQVLKVLVALESSGIRAKRLDEGQRWYEIDDIQDLDIAQSMFAPEESRVKLLSRRYGGYWRYPGLLDFCYLVNAYFPPQKLLDEMSANFSALVCQYPSGMDVNSLLAARNFSLRQDQILTGNGASELIKAITTILLSRNPGLKTGMIRPTFDEYAHRLPSGQLICYTPDNDAFAYSAEDLIRFFGSLDIDLLILANPDNPSGNYIPRAGMNHLAAWAKENHLILIADESFVDFSDEAGASLLEEEFLDENPQLIVVKSISKSYGIPGLRLGVAASSDTGLIRDLKKDVAIWNINSFGEFFMQILEKYRKDYNSSLSYVRAERERFITRLSSIKGLRTYPSQANFIMAELKPPFQAASLTRSLLLDYNMFIKDLSSKNGAGSRQLIRLAVRNREDDDRLICALNKLLG